MWVSVPNRQARVEAERLPLALKATEVPPAARPCSGLGGPASASAGSKMNWSWEAAATARVWKERWAAPAGAAGASHRLSAEETNTAATVRPDGWRSGSESSASNAQAEAPGPPSPRLRPLTLSTVPPAAGDAWGRTDVATGAHDSSAGSGPSGELASRHTPPPEGAARATSTQDTSPLAAGQPARQCQGGWHAIEAALTRTAGVAGAPRRRHEASQLAGKPPPTSSYGVAAPAFGAESGRTA